jgi:hypothetical protein
MAGEPLYIGDKLVKTRSAIHLSPLTEFGKTWCTKLLTDLAKWPITAPFRVPVDPERDGAPTYRQIVTHPMDFQTMRKKLGSSEYRSVQEFIDDIQLICDNAKLFNGVNSMYGLICDDVMAEVQKQFSEKPTCPATRAAGSRRLRGCRRAWCGST